MSFYHMTPSEMDEEAFDEALEAFWQADGGTYGGVRAAILQYNKLVSDKQPATAPASEMEGA